jgi:hypothetical protein
METHSILVAIPNESLYVIRLTVVLRRWARVQGVSHRPLATKARVQYRASPCELCGDKSWTATGFSSENFGIPTLWIPPTGNIRPILPTHLQFKTVVLPERQADGVCEPSNKVMLLRMSARNDLKSTWTWNAKSNKCFKSHKYLTKVDILDVHGSVHHSTIHEEKSNKTQQCIKFVLFPIYIKLNTYCAWQRPPTTRPTTFHVWKTRGRQCSFRLLMMGDVSPKTCWASYK